LLEMSGNATYQELTGRKRPALGQFSIIVLTRHYRNAGRIREMRIIDAERREFRPIVLLLFQVTKRNTS
jgi:hypothetical protein